MKSDHSARILEFLDNLEEEYEHIRKSLVALSHAEFEAAQRQIGVEEFPGERPPILDEVLRESLDVSSEDETEFFEQVEDIEAKGGAALDEHYDSTLLPQYKEQAKRIDEIRALTTLGNGGFDGRWATPYATISTAGEREQLETTCPDAEIHNPSPWAEQKKGEIFQNLYANVRGSGSGLSPLICIKDYNTLSHQTVEWLYYYTPDADSSGWSCVAEPIAEGSYMCVVNDTAFSSKWATVSLTARMELIPSGAVKYLPIDGHQTLYRNMLLMALGDYDAHTLIKKEGQDVTAGEYGQWRAKMRLRPNPKFVTEPHWVVVRLHAHAEGRGECRASLNFSAESDEAQSIPFSSYGTLCLGARCDKESW